MLVVAGSERELIQQKPAREHPADQMKAETGSGLEPSQLFCLRASFA